MAKRGIRLTADQRATHLSRELRPPFPAREGDLKVWWIPQVPGRAFEISVSTEAEGRRLCSILADYDLFQYKWHIKPDYSNSGGVARFEDGEWCDVEKDEEDGDREKYQNALKQAGWGGLA